MKPQRSNLFSSSSSLSPGVLNNSKHPSAANFDLEKSDVLAPLVNGGGDRRRGRKRWMKIVKEGENGGAERGPKGRDGIVGSSYSSAPKDGRPPSSTPPPPQEKQHRPPKTDVQRPPLPSRNSNNSSNGGRFCLLLFDRASPHWWNPQFDSPILEKQFRTTTHARTTRRFQRGLLYLFLLSVTLAVYFPAMRTRHWPAIMGLLLAVICLLSFLLFVTTTDLYRRHSLKISLLVSLLLCSLSLLATAEAANGDVSPSGLYALYLTVTLLLYTAVPLPLFATVAIGVVYSTATELLLCRLQTAEGGIGGRTSSSSSRVDGATSIAVNVLLHVCIHVLGLHALLTLQVRMRDTFMKVGHSLMVKKQLVNEKALKEKMIHSVMPPKVADWLMKEGHADEDEHELSSSYDDIVGGKRPPSSSLPCLKTSPTHHGDLRAIFRPFNMNAMTDVSILFADIVGFTKMSSNKTAPQLVGLLNDLFGRFDYLCGKCNCEKISTLGDCYYCVSGCPEPVADHARNCVEMGLSMISAIREFDEDRLESINMRVGIHTGTVLCGIVGKRRFKFDVWSNDVSLANQMESTGRPGMVHISEKTRSLLKDGEYVVEEGERIKDLRTFFITGRVNCSFTIPLDPRLVRRASKISRNVAKCDGSGSRQTPESICNNNKSKRKFSWSNGRRRSSVERSDQQRNQGASIPVTINSPTSSPSETGDKVENGQSLTTSTDEETSATVDADAAAAADDDVEEEEDGTSSCSYSYTDTLTSDVSTLLLAAATASLAAKTVGHDPTPLTPHELAQRRMDSDRTMLGCLKEDAGHHYNFYFSKPPLRPFTLCFTDPKVERDYRLTAWRPPRRDPLSPDSNSSSSLNVTFDVLTSGLLLLTVSVSCTLRYWPPSLPWILFFVPAFLYYLLLAAVCFTHLSQQPFSASSSSSEITLIRRLYCWGRGWYPSHALGLVLLALPILSVLANFSCSRLEFSSSPSSNVERVFYLQLAFLGLAHFSNLTALNNVTRSLAATVVTALLILLASPAICSCWNDQFGVNSNNLESAISLSNHSSRAIVRCDLEEQQVLFMETLLCLLLLLALIWMLNRESETSYRLSFHCSLLSARDRRKIQSLKDQADWLLHNIIPRHVSDKLKKSMQEYSENHRDVGVMFASLVNFNELYDESYMGGKEYLRVLNELISDFDEVLDRPEFRSVDKIKTIGSTFMAATGLNQTIRRENPHKFQHLHELMDFALELQECIADFNQSLISFNLILRIGFNYGDVTAGVIGTTKLYYDIWGDAVNVASRMDSTGVGGRIQVTEKARQVLSEWYEFERRGSIFVKGKDNMITYLLTESKKSLKRPHEL